MVKMDWHKIKNPIVSMVESTEKNIVISIMSKTDGITKFCEKEMHTYCKQVYTYGEGKGECLCLCHKGEVMQDLSFTESTDKMILKGKADLVYMIKHRKEIKETIDKHNQNA